MILCNHAHNMSYYEQLFSKAVFHYFEEISKIPHCSFEEQKISDYLVNFAKERNLEVYQDEALNVIIKKPATSGYENVPAIILQGHMDMVCEKMRALSTIFKTKASSTLSKAICSMRMARHSAQTTESL